MSHATIHSLEREFRALTQVATAHGADRDDLRNPGAARFRLIAMLIVSIAAAGLAEGTDGWEKFGLLAASLAMPALAAIDRRRLVHLDSLGVHHQGWRHPRSIDWAEISAVECHRGHVVLRLTSGSTERLSPLSTWLPGGGRRGAVMVAAHLAEEVARVRAVDLLGRCS